MHMGMTRQYKRDYSAHGYYTTVYEGLQCTRVLHKSVGGTIVHMGTTPSVGGTTVHSEFTSTL